MGWIEWCKCHRRILTTGQMNEGKPCELCQAEAKRHAETFKDRFEKLGEETNVQEKDS